MDQRKFARIAAQFPMSFFDERITEDKLVGQGTMCNLSAEGCMVKSETSVEVGRYLALRLDLPDQASPIYVELAAVRWSVGQEFGLEFLYMGTAEEALLSRLVKTLEAGLHD